MLVLSSFLSFSAFGSEGFFGLNDNPPSAVAKNWDSVVLIVANLFDMLDGNVARLTGNVTRFGGFLDSSLDRLSGQDFGGARVVKADDFTYTDPVDHAVTPNAGIRIFLEDGSRVIFRMSGTGTEGATLRVYLERFSTKWDQDVSAMVEPLARTLRQFLRLKERFGRDEPDVIT